MLPIILVASAQRGHPWVIRADLRTRKRILLVEDDPDIREALAAFFEVEGFEVTVRGDAESALIELRHKTFDTVITDYGLPGHDGGWLLCAALEERRIERARSFIYTALESPEAHGFRVLHKPMDLGDLLEAIEEGMEERTPRLSPGIPRVELALYVSARSPASASAIETVKRVLRRYDARTVELVIHDLDHPASLAAAEEDRIIFTPTLVRRAPLPRAWVLGDLRDRRRVHDLIDPFVAAAGPPRS